MDRNWESWLATASGPASNTEEQERDRTEQGIRRAVTAASDLPSSVNVYAKGSYAVGTNVRRDADVDVAVEWNNTIKVMKWGKTKDLSAQELGYTPVHEPVTPADFRRRVERAMTAAFGPQDVDASPDKHIGIAESSSRLEADVVPCFSLDRYDAPYDARRGHRIFPKTGRFIDNYPHHHKRNTDSKDDLTYGRYRELVRCMKRLIGELYDEGRITQDYPGYLTESLVYNVDDALFGNQRRLDDLLNILAFLGRGLQSEDTYLTWTEPNGLKMLFRGRSDRRPANASQIVEAASRMVNG